MLELLQGSDHVIQKDQEMSPAEERALRAMDVEEVGRICWKPAGTCHCDIGPNNQMLIVK